MEKILTGAASWQVAQWRESYYPADLPADWRLAYYANEFATTFIECRTFADVHQAQRLGNMLKDCYSGFQPVLRINIDTDARSHADTCFKLLHEWDSGLGARRLAGVLLHTQADGIHRDEALSWRQCVPSILPIALDGDNIRLHDDEYRWLAEQDISGVWRPDLSVDKNLRHWLASVDLNYGVRNMASHIRAFFNTAAGGSVACMIADSGYKDINQLYELSTIVQLMHDTG